MITHFSMSRETLTHFSYMLRETTTRHEKWICALCPESFRFLCLCEGPSKTFSYLYYHHHLDFEIQYSFTSGPISTNLISFSLGASHFRQLELVILIITRIISINQNNLFFQYHLIIVKLSFLSFWCNQFRISRDIKSKLSFFIDHTVNGKTSSQVAKHGRCDSYLWIKEWVTEWLTDGLTLSGETVRRCYRI